MADEGRRDADAGGAGPGSSGLLVVIVGHRVAAWSWAGDQWYVGVDTGNVAVYSGVDVSLGPISLS